MISALPACHQISLLRAFPDFSLARLSLISCPVIRIPLFMTGFGNGDTECPKRARRRKPRIKPRMHLQTIAPVLNPCRTAKKGHIWWNCCVSMALINKNFLQKAIAPNGFLWSQHLLKFQQRLPFCEPPDLGNHHRNHLFISPDCDKLPGKQEE
jgi:hypothetical protein